MAIHWFSAKRWEIGLEKFLTKEKDLAMLFINELGFRADVIEAQLAHRERNTVRLAYNCAEYMEESRQLMQK